MTFEDFRRWALDSSRGAARRWEEPEDDEIKVVLAADDYDAFQITRSSSGLPSVGDWEIYATDKDGLSGALPNRIRKALDNRGARRGPTMPAAEMVLGSWDVPHDFFPWAAHCGPLDYASESTMSTYMALFRPESPGPTIVTQAITFAEADAPSGHIEGAMQVLRETGNAEFAGAQLGKESHYFEGKLDGNRLYRYTALWRYPGVFCEIAVAAPPGRFTKSDLHRYAATQATRATGELAK